MADITLTTTTTIPATAGITATVHEDTDQNGSSDFSDSVALSGGTDESNTLSGFTGGTGNDYWVVFSITPTTDLSDAPTITEFTVDSGSGGGGGATFSKVLTENAAIGMTE